MFLFLSFNYYLITLSFFLSFFLNLILYIITLHAQVYLWYPLSIVTGGTTAKIMVAAKDNFLGKYIYKDTLDRNLAAVIYRVTLLPFPLFVSIFMPYTDINIKYHKF